VRARNSPSRVVDNLAPPVPSVPRPPGLGITTVELGRAARTRLDDLAAQARTAFDGRIVGHLAAGSPSKQILQLAIDLQADVILVGTHGRTGVRRMLLGSVAETVARKASCPVIVVRPKDYHAFVPPEIEPACPDCLRVQTESGGARLWCDRHSERHPRVHVHYELPEGFALGSQLIRPE
jgi:nucleotide-binding universal stress UspA family protein